MHSSVRACSAARRKHTARAVVEARRTPAGNEPRTCLQTAAAMQGRHSQQQQAVCQSRPATKANAYQTRSAFVRRTTHASVRRATPHATLQACVVNAPVLSPVRSNKTPRNRAYMYASQTSNARAEALQNAPYSTVKYTVNKVVLPGQRRRQNAGSGCRLPRTNVRWQKVVGGSRRSQNKERSTPAAFVAMKGSRQVRW